MGYWSELPKELLEAIEENVSLYADKARLCSVCVPWRSHQKLHQSPCLLLPYGNNNRMPSSGIFNPLDKKFYQLELPELVGGEKLFKGSSHGWVVTAEDNSPSLRLLNPLTRAQLKLPPRYRFPDVEKYQPGKGGYEYLVRHSSVSIYAFGPKYARNKSTTKIVLSTSPANNNDYLAVATYGEFDRLAYCRKGYTKWVHLYGDRRHYADIIFFREQLYALVRKGHLLIFEIEARPKVTRIMEIAGPPIGSNQLYLVEYSGGLLMVQREYCFVDSYDPEKNKDEPSYKKYRTCRFIIYKLDASGSCWIEVKNLGGESLFLGKNSSLSISLCDSPGCKGNRIYFTDDNSDVNNQAEFQGVGFDMGIYDLDDGKMEALPLPGYEREGKNLFWPPPIWVMPKA